MRALRQMAEEKQVTPAQLSLAWMLAKKPYIVPIPGSRKPERLLENARAAEIVLTDEEIEKIDQVIGRLDAAVFSGPPKSLEKRWDQKA